MLDIIGTFAANGSASNAEISDLVVSFKDFYVAMPYRLTNFLAV